MDSLSATKLRSCSSVAGWRNCVLCRISFKDTDEFVIHLRIDHCTKEGGSFVCRYGMNDVCSSLPMEGVDDHDYEKHVLKNHATTSRGKDSEKQWSILDASVNLASVLNDPTKAKRETDFFTKTWGDVFDKAYSPTHSSLRPISKLDFDIYSRKICRKLSAVKKLNNKLLCDRTKLPCPASQSQLKEVPKLFMSSLFNLKDPDTFQEVFLPQSPSYTSARGLLQERMTHWLDIIEIELSYQISKRSSSFFTAVASHGELRSEVSQAREIAGESRECLQRVNRCLTTKALDVFRLSRKSSRLELLHSKLCLMATVQQTQNQVQLLLSTSEYVGALDLIDTTQHVLVGELVGIRAFRHLYSQLEEVRKIIDVMLEEELSRYSRSDLTRPLTDAPTIMDDNLLTSIVFGIIRVKRSNFLSVFRDCAASVTRALLRETVVELLGDGTNPQDQIKSVGFDCWLKVLKEVFGNVEMLLQRIKLLLGVFIKVYCMAANQPLRVDWMCQPELPSISNDCPPNDAGGPICHGNSSPFLPKQASQHRRNASCDMTTPGDQRLDCSNRHRRRSSSGANDRPSEAEQDPVDVLDPMLDSKAMITEDVMLRLVDSTRQTFHYLSDYAQDKLNKMVLLRRDDRLSSVQFLRQFQLIESFCCACERSTNRRGASLRSANQSQVAKFVSRFHDERRTKLSLILDSEQWKQATVPGNIQALVDSVMERGFPGQMGTGQDDARDTVHVSGEVYIVAGTVLILITMLCEYCQCAEDIPLLSTDMVSKIANLLILFNSKTCQLVLGAGAIQLVGLKTITTGNLALASRSLQFVVRLFPELEAFFDRRLIDKQASLLKQIQYAKKDFLNHIKELREKLVYIMDHSIDATMNSYEVRAPSPNQSVRMVCRNLVKFHEAVASSLPGQELVQLFSSLHAVFMERLRRKRLKANILQDGGPQCRLLSSDVAHYRSAIGALSGLSDVDFNFDLLWT